MSFRRVRTFESRSPDSPSRKGFLHIELQSVGKIQRDRSLQMQLLIDRGAVGEEFNPAGAAVLLERNPQDLTVSRIVNVQEVLVRVESQIVGADRLVRLRESSAGSLNQTESCELSFDSLKIVPSRESAT